MNVKSIETLEHVTNVLKKLSVTRIYGVIDHAEILCEHCKEEHLVDIESGSMKACPKTGKMFFVME